ncbi:MAG: hypothetical protein DRI86_07430 [Bacteroidetes bacterium]|nr:MAG: hypothetical protein DRI86_07430 [Bacteroidota bacterium]
MTKDIDVIQYSYNLLIKNYMKKEKDFSYNITLKFTQITSAKNEAEAREILRETFLDDFNIDLSDDEIKLIK